MEIDIGLEALSRKDIGRITKDFLSEVNRDDEFPVEIELIAEELGIMITPIPKLKDIAGIEGFIKPDLSAIAIDEKVYFSYSNRARFTIAHEVGHYVLHQQVFRRVREAMSPDSFDDYASFLVGRISNKDYDWVEWQAYEFAGQVLVPSSELKKKVEELLNTRHKLHEEVAFPIVEELAVFFDVSSYVIEKRIKHDGLVEFVVQSGLG